MFGPDSASKTSRLGHAPLIPVCMGWRHIANALPHKRTDNLIKLRWILQPHKVAAAFGLVEDLDPRSRDLLANPFLRLGVEEARPATEHQGRNIGTLQIPVDSLLSQTQRYARFRQNKLFTTFAVT